MPSSAVNRGQAMAQQTWWRDPGALVALLALVLVLQPAEAAVDTNRVFNPCGDTRVQILDGFTFGLVFNTNSSFYLGRSQLSPCDRRLNLYAGRISAFRPRVDEISLLTINETSFNLEDMQYVVAYAGSRFGARSKPHSIADSNSIVTNLNLVLEFRKGRLINLLWKNDDCRSCPSGNSSQVVCRRDGDCAIAINNCKQKGGKLDCSLGFQVTFSGTDKNQVVMNTWYQVERLHQYSLYNLYSNLKSSLWNQLFF